MKNKKRKKVIDYFKNGMKNRNPLIDAIEFYAKNVNKNYLTFIERELIDEFGDSVWIDYVEGAIQKIHEGESLGGKKLGTNLISKILFGRSSHDGKWKTNYPQLMKVIEIGLENFKSKNKLSKLYTVALNNKLTQLESLNEFQVEEIITEFINEKFIKTRKKMTRLSFFQDFLEVDNLKHFAWIETNLSKSKYGAFILSTVEKKIEEQTDIFITTNKNTMTFNNNVWVLYYMNDNFLRNTTLDFSEIISKELKDEIKLYIKRNYTLLKTEYLATKFLLIKRAIKCLEENFQIKHLRDVTAIQFGFLIQHLQSNGEVSTSTISDTRTALSDLSNFLIEMENYKYKPDFNVFEGVSFYNKENMKKNTQYIPEEVVKQIEKSIGEINYKYQLIYKIFTSTGMRAKEVIELEYDCCDENSKYDGYVKLSYIPHKVKKSRRKSGLSDQSFVYIEPSLAKEIKRHTELAKELRKESGSKLLFLTKHQGNITMTSIDGFIASVNRLIKKYEIKTYNGEVWKFNSRQLRKNVAVDLIESGATMHQISNQLGHVSQKTTEKYYAEVQLKKLAELDTEFFRNKFRLLMGKENLDIYNEEERRQLYIDFCLNKREVEFGACTKHASEGPCGKRTGATSCVTCDKLCTGILYIDKWIELKESQEKILNDLLEVYHRNKITDYDNFVEYKREKRLLDSYNSIIKNINN